MRKSAVTGRRRRYAAFAAVGAGGLLALAALIAYLGGAFTAGDVATTDAGAQSPAATSAGPADGGAPMSLAGSPQELPEIMFRDGAGQPLTLTDFHGRVVLLNIWATWCGPCRREMPTLDRLQAMLGGPEFEVVALSIDRAGIDVVSTFYDEIGVGHLAKYIDDTGDAARKLRSPGLPTTVLIDREGREIARHVGPAEWDTPEMVAFFRRQLGRQSGALWPEPAGKGAHEGASDPAMPPAPRRNLRAARLPAPGHTTSSAITKGHSS